MSMPSFPELNKIPTLEQSLSAIVVSIAMEEMALSHVLKAESEKIKFIVDCAKTKDCNDIKLDEILAVNKSADDVIKSIVKLQAILKEKLDTASKFMPLIPVPPAPPPRIPKFSSPPGYIWHKSGALYLTGRENEPCSGGIRLVHRNCESMISLPKGKTYSILFELEAKNENSLPVKIDIEFSHDNKVVKKESIAQDKPGKKVKISRVISYNALANTCVAIRLISLEKLTCVAGTITISTHPIDVSI